MGEVEKLGYLTPEQLSVLGGRGSDCVFGAIFGALSGHRVAGKATATEQALSEFMQALERVHTSKPSEFGDKAKLRESLLRNILIDAKGILGDEFPQHDVNDMLQKIDLEPLEEAQGVCPRK